MRVGPADDCRVHGQSDVVERRRAGSDRRSVVVDVGAGPVLGHGGPERVGRPHRRRTARGDGFDAQTVPFRLLDGRCEELHGAGRGRVGEEPGELERGRAIDLAGERGGVARRRDAEAAVAGVALDEHAQGLPGARGRLRETG